MNTNTIALDALKAAYITMQHMGNAAFLNNMDAVDEDEDAEHDAAFEAVRAAIAALEAQPTGWMPIESAPKDKVLLLGYFNAAGKWAACAHEFKSSTVANCLTRYTCTKCGKAHAPTATQGQDAAPAEQPQDDEPTWQELEDFRKRHWTHWNAADNLLIAHLAQKLKCAARAKE